MSHPFEALPTHLSSEELTDKAFSRAARSGRAKDGLDAQQSMLRTASNIVSDNLERVVTQWPDFDELDPFYRELADAVARRALADHDAPSDHGGGIDALRQHLSKVHWASRKADEIRREYEGRLTGDLDAARKLRKQAFARLGDVLEEIEPDLAALAAVQGELSSLPDIRPDEPTIVVAGYPNVGKSSFVNRVTNARNEIDSYPFTTTRIHVGHVERDRIRYQLVDTPGLLDRPPAERNEIESQAVTALQHVADAVIVVVDPTEECGYPLDVQLQLRDDVLAEFDVPTITVCNKSDRLDDGVSFDADYAMSVRDGDGVEAVLAAAIDAVGYDPDLPFDGSR